MTPAKLIGSIIKAKVSSVHLDNCDLILESGEKARLYQNDSLARDDHRLMHDLIQYQKGKEIDVLVTHLRKEGTVVYFTNERWAINNPWEDLELTEGDVVTGKVINEYHREKGRIINYFIQLDSDALLENREKKQPDIKILLPIEELPWKDGSSVEISDSRDSQRFELWENDRVELEIIEINTLPLYPKGSMLRRIYHRDKLFFDTAHSKQFVANLSMRMYGENLTGIPQSTIQKSQKTLHDKSILVVDDNLDNLKNLTELLENNGAKTTGVLVKNKKMLRLIQELLELIQKNTFDLALIDFALPHPNQGIQLIDGITTLVEQSEEKLPNFALMSAYLTDVEINYARKKLPTLKGCLIRPVQLDHINILCDGKKIWLKHQLIKNDVADTQKPDSQGNLSNLFKQLLDHYYIDFIVLLRIEPDNRLEWQESAGEVPFKANLLGKLAQQSELRVLISEKINELNINKKSSKHSKELLAGHNMQISHWKKLSFTSHEDLIVGFGTRRKKLKHIDLIIRLVRQQITIKMWDGWAQHHASFISSGILIHSLAHEYRNYLNRLTTLGSNFEILSQHAESNNILNDLKYLTDNLRKNTNELQELSNTLLQGLSQRVEPVNIEQLVDYVERLIKPAFNEFDTQLKIFQPPSISLGIPRAAITIPLVNLLLNAGKHQYRSEARMVVMVSKVVKYDRQSMMEFWIYDNGPGIHEKYVDRIFQVGYSDASNKEERHGIGLWLSTQILKSINGKIDLMNNRSGLGCTFRLSVPLSLA